MKYATGGAFRQALSEFTVVDCGGVLTLVPLFQDPVRAGAGMLKGNGSLTGVIVEEHRQESE